MKQNKTTCKSRQCKVLKNHQREGIISKFGTQETCLMAYILVIFLQTKVIIKRQKTVLSAHLRYFKTCRPLNFCRLRQMPRVVVSVSRRIPTSPLGLISRKIVNVSVSAIYVLCPRPTQDHHRRYRADLYCYGASAITPLPFRTSILVLRRFTAWRLGRVNSSSDAASFCAAVWMHLLSREVN